MSNNETVAVSLSATSGGVQSVHRALDVMEIVAAHDGPMTISGIAELAELPQPTVHRLLKTLVDRGYILQLRDRRYAVGTRALSLGLTANRLLGASITGALADLVEELGESVNLAILAGHQAEYIAQAPSKHSMRMFTEVGRRVELHATGVGKALLAQMPESFMLEAIRKYGLPAKTSQTMATEEGLRAEVARIRDQGFAMDEEEQELGVRCVAVPVPGDLPLAMALSVSGPTVRITDAFVERAVPLLQDVASHISDQVAS